MVEVRTRDVGRIKDGESTRGLKTARKVQGVVRMVEGVLRMVEGVLRTRDVERIKDVRRIRDEGSTRGVRTTCGVWWRGGGRRNI